MNKDILLTKIIKPDIKLKRLKAVSRDFRVLHAHLCHVTCNIKSQAMNDNKTLLFYLLLISF